MDGIRGQMLARLARLKKAFVSGAHPSNPRADLDEYERRAGLDTER